MLNEQTPSPPFKNEDGELQVHSIFYTIQGEGVFSGQPCVFVRLEGCNLQCPGCDTNYTSQNVSTLDVDCIYATIQEKYQALYNNDPLVVITGGEPARQNIAPLVNLLLDNDYRVQIETNGTIYMEGLPYGSQKLTIVCSPKTRYVNEKLVSSVDYWKYVVSVDSLVGSPDGLPVKALKHTTGKGILYRPPPWHPAPIYLSPADEKDPKKNRANMLACARSCLEHGYQLSLQINKIIGVN